MTSEFECVSACNTNVNGFGAIVVVVSVTRTPYTSVYLHTGIHQLIRCYMLCSEDELLSENHILYKKKSCAQTAQVSNQSSFWMRTRDTRK